MSAEFALWTSQQDTATRGGGFKGQRASALPPSSGSQPPVDELQPSLSLSPLPLAVALALRRNRKPPREGEREKKYG